MALTKKPGADLKKKYPLYMQIGLVLSLALMIAAFTVRYDSNREVEIMEEDQEVIEIEEIEQTQQVKPPPPPPPAPPPPEEVPDDVEVQEDIIEDIEMDFDAPAPPPPPPPAPEEEPPPPEPEPEPEIFDVVEQQPVLIGGIEGLQDRVEYPEMARRSGVEGRVFLQFVVNEDGTVSDVTVARSPSPLLSDAAIEALEESRFEPGVQRGRPVKVRFSIPVNFSLQ